MRYGSVFKYSFEQDLLEGLLTQTLWIRVFKRDLKLQILALEQVELTLRERR